MKRFVFVLTGLFLIHYKSTASNIDTARTINVKELGAKGDGRHDDTQTIKDAIIYAKAHHLSAVYFPAGNYSIQQTGIKSGIITLLNGVGLKGAGPKLCHIILSGKRYNPPAIFYQAWWDEPTVNDIVIEGIDFDGGLQHQKFDSLYQYCHALSINNGKNIEVKNCKFENFRGDGLLFGDTFESSPNLRSTSDVSVHDNEFYNIYREGVLFCSVKGASFYNNFLHGNGFFVGGVDIERHSVNETVQNIQVYHNVFDFRDGYGPFERGGPIARYRRAVTIGFFYKGYTNKIADGLSGGHSIYNNKIYQGQIDCWGHTNVTISQNVFSNFYENIKGIGWLSPPVINISDPGATKGLTNVSIIDNTINSAIDGNGILVNNYTDVLVKGNIIAGTKEDGVNILASGGTFENNTIKNIGTPKHKVFGIVINGTCPHLLILNNKVTGSSPNSYISYAIGIQSRNDSDVKPVIEYNTAVNVTNGIVDEFSDQPGYVILKGNKKEQN